MNGEDIRLAIGMLLGMDKVDPEKLILRVDVNEVFDGDKLTLVYAKSRRSIMVFRDMLDLEHHSIGEVFIGDFSKLSRESQRGIIKLIKGLCDMKINPKGEQKTEE